MVAKYTFKLINKNKDTEFRFYASMPTSSSLDKIVWYRKVVPLGGSKEIQTDLDVYAWCGSAANTTQGVAESVIIGSISIPGTTWKTMSTGKAMKLIEAQPAASPGAFEIYTGSDFKTEDNFLIGAAWSEPGNPANRVPVKVYLAEPNKRYQITTQPIFYVAAIGASKTATLPVGIWNFGATGMLGMNHGELTFKADGTFSPAVYKKT